MNRKSVQAKVLKNVANATSLLIRTRGTTIETEFAELRPCEFPIWTSSPVLVEIPPSGTKSFSVGVFSGSVTGKTPNGDFPSIVKFPIYTKQQIVGTKAFEELACPGTSHILAKVPLAAVATAASGVVDGKLVQRYYVLPFWNDGSAVLVRLDWFEGEPAEGTPNPEWHMTASTGMPAAVTLKHLERAAQLPSGATHCRYQIHVTPWLLGAELLEDKGQEIQHPVWQREWSFDHPRDFSSAVCRITRGLLGSDPLSERDAA